MLLRARLRWGIPLNSIRYLPLVPDHSLWQRSYQPVFFKKTKEWWTRIIMMMLMTMVWPRRNDRLWPSTLLLPSST